MKQCGLRKAFANGGMLGYTPTAGESAMLKSLDERMGWGPEAAAAAPATPAAPKINPAPIPGADDNGILPGEWGYNQNGGSRKSTMLNNLLDDMRGGSKSGRRVAGAGVAALLRESPNLMSSEDLYEKIGSTRSASGRMGLGQAMTGQLMRGYAQGGTIDPDALMREMAAKYGTGGGQPQPAPAPQPAPQPAQVQAPAPKPTLLQGLHRLATGNLEGRMKAAGFKHGGTVDDKGYIHGEKGVDKVPAKIAESGEDILVSHGERIVNKKQNAALEKLAAAAGMGLDEYLEQSTGEPVGPSMKQGLRGLNKGGFVDDFGNLQEPAKFQGGANRTVLHQQIANAAADAQTAPTGQTVSRIPAQPAPTTAAPAQPAPAAAAPAQPATRMGRLANGLKSALRSPLTLAPALLQGEAMLIDAIDSIPSLRGQHTATSTDMSIPESDRAVLDQKDLEARDAAWAVRHNKPSLSQPKQPVTQLNPGDKGYNENFDPVDRRSTQARQADGAVNDLELKGLRNAQQFLGGESAVIPTGLRTARQIESNAPLTTWNSKEDVAAASLRNAVTPENRTGIMSVRQKDGSFKNVAIGQSEYVGADGKPTNDWSKTQQYADGVARAQRDKAELDQIQRQRANFDAFNPSITDPNVRDSGLRRMMMYAAGDAAAAKAAQEKRAQDIQIRGQDITLRGQNNMQSNSDREFEHKTDEAHQKRLEDVLKAKATVDGKLNGEKYAWLQAYAGNFNSKHAKNSDAFFKDLADNLEVDSAFQADDGNFFRRVGSLGADAVRGLKPPKEGLLWGENYVDPRTGREVSASDIAKMSPGAREVLKQRMAQQ